MEPELLTQSPLTPELDVCAVLSVCNPPGAARSALWPAHFLVSSAIRDFI